MNPAVRLHNIVMHTKALGPQNRMAIWFQGCTRHCKGCMSPQSRPVNGGRVIPVQDLIHTICSADDIEGITISGGEPFLQTDALYLLLSALRKETDLGVIIYTGFTVDELLAQNNPKVEAILSGLADIIIDGEYIDELNDGGSLKGSSNQKVVFLTKRYLPYKHLYEGRNRDVQVVISGDEALLVGIPDRDMLEVWKKAADKLQERVEQPERPHRADAGRYRIV